MDSKIRIVVIDDQEVFRVGLRVGLDAFPDIYWDGEAADGAAGLTLVAERKPDVAIVDIWMPGMDGLEVAERIQQCTPETRIILVSGCFDDAAIARGVILAVDGIVTKADSPRQIAAFIRLVDDGVFCFSPSIGVNQLPLLAEAVVLDG